MKDLTIPEKITLENEVVPNIWRRDIPKLLAIAVPGAIIGIIVWACTSQKPLIRLVSMLVTCLYLCLSYALVARIDGSRSILSHLELTIRFYREQQRFYYKQGKEQLCYVETDRSKEADGPDIH